MVRKTTYPSLMLNETYKTDHSLLILHILWEVYVWWEVLQGSQNRVPSLPWSRVSGALSQIPLTHSLKKAPLLHFSVGLLYLWSADSIRKGTPNGLEAALGKPFLT